jgi:CRP-like cAMP-binding protein
MISIMSDTLSSLFSSLRGHTFRFALGQKVFQLGNPVHHMHLVQSGLVHLIRHSSDGAAIVLQRAGPGSVLAEASAYSERYHCDARAETAIVTWGVARTDFRRRIAEDKAFGQLWAHLLAREVQSARLRAEMLALRTVAARLDAWIAWNGPLPEKGKWLTIASEIGVSPEALYREIAKRRR